MAHDLIMGPRSSDVIVVLIEKWMGPERYDRMNNKRPTLVFFLAPTKPLQSYE
jgi:hypothetical protein